MSSLEKDHFLFIYDLCAIGTFSFSSSSFFYCLMHFIKSSNNFLGFPHFLEPSEAARPEASRLLHCLIFFEHFPPRFETRLTFAHWSKNSKYLRFLRKILICWKFVFTLLMQKIESSLFSQCVKPLGNPKLLLCSRPMNLWNVMSVLCASHRVASLSSTTLEAQAASLCSLTLMQWIYVLYCSSSF